MTIARLYRMNAAEGKEDALAEALQAAAQIVAKAPGSEGVEVLRDVEAPGRFVFIEKWATIEDHKAAPGHLPKGGLDAVMAAMAGPPDGAYLDYLLTV
ncbi:MAG: Antibiotic biosynthesis monooxygenase [Sphingomonas bacterium]|nr:antibiotic biosynthesis monooxygenase family protein [Sphingomonas bacterium]MDB5689349.1 Antibiotic biosynthesis monooxygenase [Sphingomonas bacterium]